MSEKKKQDMYHGRAKRSLALILSVFTLLALMLSIERAVIDAFGQMWTSMLINSLAIVCNITGLLAMCAKDPIVLALYCGWTVLSIGLNVVMLLIYNDIGLLAQKQKYLGALIGNDNFWKTHGLGCGWDNLGKLGGDEGSGLTVVSGDDMLDLLDPEPSPSSCVVPYMVVETVHAAVYMFVAVVSFFLCCCILVYPGKRRRVSDYEDEEEFSYVSVAQRYDYPEAQTRSLRRHSLLDYW